jgi:rubrerythrin
MSGTPTEEIIKFAIEKEIEAAAFYENLAGKVKNTLQPHAQAGKLLHRTRYSRLQDKRLHG